MVVNALQVMSPSRLYCASDCSTSSQNHHAHDHWVPRRDQISPYARSRAVASGLASTLESWICLRDIGYCVGPKDSLSIALSVDP